MPLNAILRKSLGQSIDPQLNRLKEDIEDIS